MRTGLVRQRGFSITIALVVAGGLLAPWAPAYAADPPNFTSATSTARAAIEAAVAHGSVDSITIGLTDAKGLIWTSAAGRVAAPGSVPTATTQFGIGSVTKMLTTTAVMQLVDQGKVGLDQPVAKYLPDFTMLSPQYRQITVRMLLNHTSGFPGSDYANGMTYKPFPGYSQQVMDTLAQSTLKTTPGALSVYCNDCFTVAGQLVAAVSGMPITTYITRNVLQPLGMTNSGFITNEMPPVGTVARTFDDGVMRPQEVTNVYASGGLLSTPTDMSALARMFLNNGTTGGVRVLSPQSVAEMGRDQIASTLTVAPGPALIFGLGWDSVSPMALRFEGVPGWSKNGSTNDYHADFFVAPDAGLAVFASGAGEQPGIDDVVATIATHLLLDALRAQGTIGTRSMTVTPPPLATPTENDVNAMLGIYLAAANGSMRVTKTDEAGVLQLSKFLAGAWLPFELIAFRADGAWWPINATTHAWRTLEGWSRNYLVQVIHSGDQVANFVFAQRVQASGPMTKAWSTRVGPWLVVNELPDSMSWQGPIQLLTRIPGMPGYLDFGGSPINAQGTIGTMFAQVPVNNGRDQNDAVPMADGMLRSGHLVLRPAATVPDLPSPVASITIGPEGYAQWFHVPDKSRLALDGGDAWFLYGPDMGLLASSRSGAKTEIAPASALLVVLGQPGAKVTVASR